MYYDTHRPIENLSGEKHKNSFLNDLMSSAAARNETFDIFFEDYSIFTAAACNQDL